MVFWIVCTQPAGTGGETRFGPFESEAVAARELARLRARYLGTSARCFQVVLDYA